VRLHQCRPRGEYISDDHSDFLILSSNKSNFGKILCLIFIFTLLPGGIFTSSAIHFNSHYTAAPTRSRGTISSFNRFAGMLRPKANSLLLAPTTNYDEQIGETFTDSFTSMAYNVTALPQVDSDGCGPAYLLNGLSNVGYWYQVGLSYDWNCASGGFMMNYEVFNSGGASIFPTNGYGGLLAYTGTVNSGDLVLLNLYFGTGSYSGEVVMYSYDWNTGAYASETYSNQGANDFIGLSNATANGNGFFTGLMTEEYHSAPYYGGEQFVVYNEQDFVQPSASQWIDEYYVPTKQTLFFADSSSPVLFGNYHQLQSFSSNGASEYADAFVFETGSDPLTINLSFQPAFTDMGMQSRATFSASASGGTGPYDYLVFLDNNLFTNYTSSNGNYQATLGFGSLTGGSHDYYIDVISSDGYPASSQSVSVTVNSDPSTSVTVNRSVIDLGQSETFSSSIQGGSPSYSLSWYINGQELTQQQTSSSSSSYSFKPASIGNFTVYSSLLDAADFSTTSSSQTFAVNQDPKLSWSITPQSSSFFVTNSAVSASAVTSRGTAPYTYTWYLNGVEVAQTNSPNYTYSFSKMRQYNLGLNVTDSAGFVVMATTISVNYAYNFVSIGLIIGIIVALVVAGLFFALKRKSKASV
jgi:hypothetical protein